MSRVSMILIAIIIILIGIIIFYGVQLLSRYLGQSNQKEAQAYSNITGGMGGEQPKKDNKKDNKQEEKQNLLGGYVAYTPENGTYKEVTNNGKYAGTPSNVQDFQTENLGWRIWSIDSKKMVLVADKAVSTGGKNGKLIVDGAIGYNNGVKLLNDLCSTCYSNKSLGAVARSINIEDIENVLNKNIWKPEDYSYKANGQEYHTYLSAKTFIENKTYPYIHQFEEYSDIDSAKKEKGKGITRSEQESLYSGEVYKTYEAVSALTPTETYWTNTFSDKNFIDAIYYNLIFKEQAGFWLASRCVGGASEYAAFAMQYVSANKVDAYPLVVSKANVPLGNIEGYKVRPIVEIDLSKVNLDTKSGTGENLEKAYKLEAK